MNLISLSRAYHTVFCWFRNHRAKSDAEFFKLKRLEEAEAELETLRDRANVAITFLTERHTRNHWSESVHDMITGTKGGYG